MPWENNVPTACYSALPKICIIGNNQLSSANLSAKSHCKISARKVSNLDTWYIIYATFETACLSKLEKSADDWHLISVWIVHKTEHEHHNHHATGFVDSPTKVTT